MATMLILAQVGQEQSGCVFQILPQSYRRSPVYVLLASVALWVSWYGFSNAFPCNLGYMLQ